jgi:hypothetical protein
MTITNRTGQVWKTAAGDIVLLVGLPVMSIYCVEHDAFFLSEAECYFEDKLSILYEFDEWETLDDWERLL